MRLTVLAIVVACVAGCGGDSGTSTDLGAADLSASAVDLTTAADLSMVAPFNMPGKVFCYTGPMCSTTSANPVCCDSRGDGGFVDTCVASAAACTTMDAQAKAYACGQAADCGSGMVCCGVIGMSGSGKPASTRRPVQRHVARAKRSCALRRVNAKRRASAAPDRALPDATSGSASNDLPAPLVPVSFLLRFSSDNRRQCRRISPQPFVCTALYEGF